MVKKRGARSQQRLEERLLKTQLEAFRTKFGRDPEPGEPVLFDPEKDVPTPLQGPSVDKEILAAMEKVNLPPQFAYAYKKTGMILMAGHGHMYPREAIVEYNAAIDEYFALEKAGKLPKK